MDKELISVIVPVYNDAQGLARTLLSLQNLEDLNYEVVVADDGSAEPVNLPQGFHGRVIRWEKNQGAGAARNNAVLAARGAILAFTDAGCAVPPDWLKVMRTAFFEPQTQAVAGTFFVEAQSSAAAWLRCLEATCYHFQERGPVNCFSGANFGIRRAVFERCGGFPSIRVGEDLILGYRLFQQGQNIQWLPQLKVSQNFHSTFAAYFKQQFRWSFAAVHNCLLFPEIYRLKWPLKRSSLDAQLFFFSIFLILTPVLFAAGRPAAAALIFLTCASSLLYLNVSLLRHASGYLPVSMLMKVLFSAVLVRNFAWSLAFFKVAPARPGLFFRFLFWHSFNRVSFGSQKSGILEHASR